MDLGLQFEVAGARCHEYVAGIVDLIRSGAAEHGCAGGANRQSDAE